MAEGFAADNKEGIQYTDCQYRDEVGCDWEHFATGDRAERECTIVRVLHSLVRHPDQYGRDTRRDPSTMVVQYREQIHAWRRHI
jgi:hypothetical protein